ncbi:MAG TPA: trypsin-like peptidase domain-containing protein [Solirubrobacteraceae bacterium]|nr:trypsin-like peptidase domain-containing protein [Solirubrobacteraceae bacterium]
MRVLSGADAGRTVEVAPDGDEPFVLGRVRGCHLVVRDERASRRHAELRPEPDGRLRLRDLDSANGTYVDGRRVEEAVLAGGEQIRIAGVDIGLEAQRPPEPVHREDASWSMVGRLVERRTRAARRATYAALAAAVLALIAVAALLSGGLGGGDDEVPDVVRRVTPSTVLVETLRGDRRTGTGSGWVLDARAGLVVTAAHVVNEGVRYRVASDGQARPASLVASAPCEDLAILQVQGVAGLRTAAVGSGRGLESGETVIALGYPAGATPTDAPTSTRGVVSVSRGAFRDPAADVPGYPQAVQTDTALNPGNSGGPLVDLDARIVGVNAAARSAGSDGRRLEGQNFAIAIDRARGVIAGLRKGRSVGWTGATFGYPTVQELAERGLPPGLYVTGAVAGTPAARAGLGGRGELLAGVDGRPVGPSLSSYCAAIAGRASGEGVRFTLVAPGGAKPREVTVALA